MSAAATMTGVTAGGLPVFASSSWYLQPSSGPCDFELGLEKSWYFHNPLPNRV